MTMRLAAPIDYDRLMQANLADVFGERDAARRREAIRQLYAENAVLNEPHSTVRGHDAICDAVTALLDSLPSDFVFTAIGPGIGHHGIGRLSWRAGPANGPSAATGMDIAQFQGGRIQVLTVFLDPPTA
jgi:hypothetical protein